jgi:hypothetical protein
MEEGFGQGGDFMIRLLVCQRLVRADEMLYATYLVQRVDIAFVTDSRATCPCL